jgi:hypothetical protein
MNPTQTEELKKLSATYREQVEQMQKNLANEMKGAFKTFFNDNPDVAALAWTQFTPYFNDGDECIFNVHDIYPVTAEELEEIKAGDLNIYDLWEREEEKEDWRKKADAFIHVLSTIDNSIFKATFGDHCKVIATREGFDVEEYEHD